MTSHMLEEDKVSCRLPVIHADIAGSQVQDEVSHVDPVGQVVAHLLEVVICQLCPPIVQGMPLQRDTCMSNT